MNSPAASMTTIRQDDTAFRQGIIDARFGRSASIFAPAANKARRAAYNAGRRAFKADPSIAASVIPNAA